MNGFRNSSRNGQVWRYQRAGGRAVILEEVLRQAGIPLLRSHDARKLLQMTGEWLNTTGADQQSPEHRS